MKTQEFGNILKDFAEVLTAVGGLRASSQINTLTTIFNGALDPTVSALVKRLKALPDAGPSGHPSAADVALLLVTLKAFLAKIAKSAILTDINLLESELARRTSMNFDAFVSMACQPIPNASKSDKVRNDLVIHYKRVLELAIGNDEQFMMIFNDLSSNANMRKEEVIALAKEVADASTNSKATALKKIRSMHQSLLSRKAKTRATRNTPAATIVAA